MEKKRVTRLISLALLFTLGDYHTEISADSTRRSLVGCDTGNPIDDCWRCDANWHKNRKRLAECAIGFGRNAVGGKNGEIYVVTDPSDDDAINPRPGTLRYGVIQSEPLWIIFAKDMSIRLSQELIVNSYKTIDGRGVNVEIAHGPCITVQYVSHVIIHGISVHDCKPGGPALVRSSPTHFGWRTISDGDGISIFGNHTLARCKIASTENCLENISQDIHNQMPERGCHSVEEVSPEWFKGAAPVLIPTLRILLFGLKIVAITGFSVAIPSPESAFLKELQKQTIQAVCEVVFGTVDARLKTMVHPSVSQH